MDDSSRHAQRLAAVEAEPCVHEWVLIEETLDKHPRYELRSGLRQRSRRFFCRVCRETACDVEKEPVNAR